MEMNVTKSSTYKMTKKTKHKKVPVTFSYKLNDSFCEV